MPTPTPSSPATASPFSPPPASKWQDSFLAGMRLVGDPLADETIDRVFAKGEIEQVNSLLVSLVRNDQVPPQGLDPVVYDYLSATRALAVTDPALVREAQAFFEEHGDLVLVALLCASLPECYTMAKGINVLWLTQRLEEHALRRLLETAQFVLRVLSPGGMDPDGAGISSAAKVRLMHAAIRRLILHEPKSDVPPNPANFSEVLLATKWDMARLGYPINQTDLAYTLLTFSYVIPRSMERLGVAMTPIQKEAFLHCWNVTGLVMGIHPDMLPANVDEAASLFDHIKRREGGASTEGQAMTTALRACVANVIPTQLGQSVPVLIMRQLMDPQTCEWLGIAKPSLLSRIAQDVLIAEVRGAALMKHEAQEHLWLTPIAWDWVAGRLMNYLTNYRQPPGWNRAVFQIPDNLVASWNLPANKPPATT